jgi:hypothetical protein
VSKTVSAQLQNQTVELIPDGVDPRLLNSLITLNYHELLPVVAPEDLSLEDPRLARVPFMVRYLTTNGRSDG